MVRRGCDGVRRLLGVVARQNRSSSDVRLMRLAGARGRPAAGVDRAPYDLRVRVGLYAPFESDRIDQAQAETTKSTAVRLPDSRHRGGVPVAHFDSSSVADLTAHLERGLGMQNCVRRQLRDHQTSLLDRRIRPATFLQQIGHVIASIGDLFGARVESAPTAGMRSAKIEGNGHVRPFPRCDVDKPSEGRFTRSAPEQSAHGLVRWA
jgi:hypothetical protein